ncbi:MAG: protein kinase, partial [Planctomycetaceae bacterium]|nr:protein kinase [Planctomycetaceae bacterium]
MSEELTVDKFLLSNCLATGTYSQIWDVTDQETSERFAMKLLLEEAFRDSEQKKILKQEFKTANTFDHPNIIHVYEHKQTKKHAYYTMEFFGGPNLKQIIRSERLVVHTRMRKLAECIVMALGQIHEKGWLHRDVKPDNIMMTRASDVRLIDFSLSSKAPSSIAKLV